MKQGKENFEFVKENDDDKGNYILQKDNLTKYGFFIVGFVLVGLIVALVFLNG